ncbi:MAG: hypothetical protein K8S54_12420 [Spirochaetia bacterium]|nr:hypothetical protein [Spirochaetia bacterium]
MRPRRLISAVILGLSANCSLFNPVTNNYPELALLLAGSATSAASPSRFLFTVSAGDNMARTLRINEESGTLSLISSQPLAAAGLRTHVHPSLPVFYSTLNATPGGIDAFAFDSETGILQPAVTQRTSGGEDFSHAISAHPNGTMVLFSIVQPITQFYRSNLTSGLPSAPALVSPALNANSQLAGLTPNGDFLYVSRATGGLERYSVAADGTMIQLGNTTISGATISGRISFSSDSKFLYTTSSANDVASFSIDGSGNLTPVSLFAAGVTNLSNAFVNPGGTRFYVLSYGNAIQTYSIASNGALTLLNQQSVASSTDFLCLDRSGRFLFIGQAAGAGDQIYSYNINSDGVPVLTGSLGTGNLLRSCAASSI